MKSLGTNFKPTDLAAAIGLAQLARLDERTAQRAPQRRLAHRAPGATTSSPAVPAAATTSGTST